MFDFLQKITEAPNIELQIVEPSDIAKVAENIDEMTKKSKDIDNEVGNEVDHKKERFTESATDTAQPAEVVAEDILTPVETDVEEAAKSPVKINSAEENVEVQQTEVNGSTMEKEGEPEGTDSKETDSKEPTNNEEKVQVEYRRNSQDNVEIMKEVDEVFSSELEEVHLRRKSSVDSLSRSDSFSVKDEIEKIEKQIKALEAGSASKESAENMDDYYGDTRKSLQANRRHFFQNMVGTDKEAIKIEFKEFPREQKDIRLVRLNDSPVPVAAPKEPVKVIELHISEPIKQKAEIVDDINPIPKPRRHSALSLTDSRSNSIISTAERKSRDGSRGKSF